MKRIVSIVALCCFIFVGGGLAAFKFAVAKAGATKRKAEPKQESGKETLDASDNSDKEPPKEDPKKTLSVDMGWGGLKITIDGSHLPKSAIDKFPIELTRGGAVRARNGKYNMGDYKCTYKEAFRVSNVFGMLSDDVISGVLRALEIHGFQPEGWGAEAIIPFKWSSWSVRPVKVKGGKSTLSWDFPLMNMSGVRYVVSLSRPYGPEITYNAEKKLYYTPTDPSGNTLVDEKTKIAVDERFVAVVPDDLVVTACIDVPPAPSFASKAAKK